MPLQRLLLLAGALAFFAAGCGSSAKLSAKALAKQADTLQAYAAEGAFLSGDAATGKTTRIFTRVHASELHDAAARAQRSLSKATTEPDLGVYLRRLARLATRTTNDLDRLGDASRNEQRSLAADLDAAAKEIERIGMALK